MKNDVKKKDQLDRIKKEEKEEENYNDVNTASSFETADLNSEEDQRDVTIKKNDEVKEYLDLLNKRKNSLLDSVYGVRKMHDNTYKIGDTSIYFEDNNIIIGDKKYEKIQDSLNYYL